MPLIMPGMTKSSIQRNTFKTINPHKGSDLPKSAKAAKKSLNEVGIR